MPRSTTNSAVRTILSIVFFCLAFVGLAGCNPSDTPPSATSDKSETKSETEIQPETKVPPSIQPDETSLPLHTATLANATGEVTIRRDGQDNPGVEGTILQENDVLSVGPKSRAEIRFEDGSVLRLACDSRVELRKLLVARDKNERVLDVKLMAGKVWANISRFLGSDTKKNQVWVRTESVSAGVRGTVFQVAVGLKEESIVRVLHGQVSVFSSSLVEQARPEMSPEEIADLLYPEGGTMVQGGFEMTVAKRTAPKAGEPLAEAIPPVPQAFDPLTVALQDRDWLAYNIREDQVLVENDPDKIRTDAYRFLPKDLLDKLLQDETLLPVKGNDPSRRSKTTKSRKTRQENQTEPSPAPEAEQPTQPASPSATPPSRQEQAVDDYLDNAVEAERQAVESYYRSIYKMMKNGQYTRARMNLENYIEEHPGWESIIGRYYLAQCLAKLGETAKAQAVLGKALRSFPRGKWAKRMRALKKKLSATPAGEP